MIELRWVIDGVSPPSLQYRTASNEDWSEWKTVPTIVLTPTYSYSYPY